MRFTCAVLVLAALAMGPQMGSCEDPCSPHTLCGPCLQTPGCTWCADPDRSHTEVARCALAFNRSDCKPEHVIDLKNEAILKTAKDLGSRVSPGSDETVVLWPQDVDVKLRVGTPLDVTIRYQVPRRLDHPLDVYYLMDLSSSMEDDLSSLKRAGADLVNRLKTLSTNVTIGFGSFVDKNAKGILTTTKRNKGNYRHPVHGYKHVLTLTDDSDKFKQYLANIQLATEDMVTNDIPEGASDAIAQVLACQEEIGWRHGARKLLLVATDAPSHWQGDGKIAGLTEPNDGGCHLSPSKEYALSSTVDYPSISLINHLVENSSVSIIFAVTGDVQKGWDRVSAQVAGSSVATLAADSSNIVALVEEQFKVISSSVDLAASGIDEVETTFTTDCGKGDSFRSTNGCDGLPPGAVVSFSARLTLERCPADPTLWRRPLVVRPVGLDHQVTLHVQMMCRCPCSDRGDPKRCGGNGIFDCGLCLCPPGHSGPQCEASPQPINIRHLPSASGNEQTHGLQSDKMHGLQSCVSCLSSKQWLEPVDCSSQCGTFTFKPKIIKDEDVGSSYMVGGGSGVDSACILRVVHSYRFNGGGEGEVEVHVQRMRECPQCVVPAVPVFSPAAAFGSASCFNGYNSCGGGHAYIPQPWLPTSPQQ